MFEQLLCYLHVVANCMIVIFLSYFKCYIIHGLKVSISELYLDAGTLEEPGSVCTWLHLWLYYKNYLTMLNYS